MHWVEHVLLRDPNIVPCGGMVVVEFEGLEQYEWFSESEYMRNASMKCSVVGKGLFEYSIFG